MKKLIKLWVLLALSVIVNSSLAQVAGANLDINNVQALINADGILFHNTGSVFYVPKSLSPSKSTIYSAAIWIGGISNGQLYVAANTYRQAGMEFFPGPVSQKYDSPYRSRYNKVWSIKKADIDAHRTQYMSSGYVVPSVIGGWPAHGDTTKGESFHLAPFVDGNSNGVYEPALGDYPEVRGDQAIYFIYNDDTVHNETKGPRMKVEIHGMAYAYEDWSDKAVFNTVFVNYKIFNRSARIYDSVYLGSFVDYDIGNYADDYVGCFPGYNIFYGYNGDDYDEGVMGYGTLPPSEGTIFLNHKLEGFTVYNNNFSGINGHPDSALSFYNYLKGRWEDGSKIIYGGNGIGTGSNPTRFMYPGNNDPLGKPEWSETSVSNPPGDRRGLGTTGPFKLKPGEQLCFDLAHVFGRTTDNTDYYSIGTMGVNALKIDSFYKAKNFDCTFQKSGPNTSVIEMGGRKSSYVVYPNPAANELTIRVEFGKNGIFEVFDLNGKRIMTSFLQNGRNMVDITDLSKGLFIYKITSENQCLSGKFIKQ